MEMGNHEQLGVTTSQAVLNGRRFMQKISLHLGPDRRFVHQILSFARCKEDSLQAVVPSSLVHSLVSLQAGPAGLPCDQQLGGYPQSIIFKESRRREKKAALGSAINAAAISP